MTNKLHHPLVRYGFAVVSIAVAIWLRLLLDPVLGNTLPYATLFVAIMLTAWYGGLRPALVAVVLGALAADYFLLPPRGHLLRADLDVQVGQLLFLATGFGIALLGGAMHAARQLAERAAQNEHHQAALIDQTYEAIFAWDWNGPITFWNSAAEHLYGFPRAEAVGRVTHDLLRTSPLGGVKGFVNALEREGSWEGELEHTSRDGARIIVESRMVLVRDATPAYVVEINRDISKRRKAEEALRAANQQLEAANRELEAFSYSVSHDLRAPLRHIDGFSQALLEDYESKLDEAGKKYLREVRGASQHMAQLIDDVLELARVTRTEMRREPVNLSEIARNVISDLRRGDQDRSVVVDIEDGLMTRGDKRLMQIMLINLLGNAWKFTSRQQRAGIVFGQTKQNGQSSYFVRDNGAGFDMAYAGKLFGAFQRLHTAAEFEGTGIGLATVQRIINRHGGRVWAEGKINEGATLYFTLPGIQGARQ